MAKNVSEFESHMADLSSLTCVAYGVGLGSNLGLFETIAKLDKPATCEAIAAAAGYRERYVREWLGLMVTGKIIDYDVTAKTYYISDHKKPFLTEAGKERNMAVFFSGIDTVFNVSRQIQECFKPEGPRGVPYSRYVGFHDWRTARVKAKFQWHVIEEALKLAPGLVQTLERGARVCDAGCSTGHQLRTMAQHYPKSTFVGFDIDDDAIKTARENAEHEGMKNVTFVVEDGCKTPDDWSNTYDVIFTWDVVHDAPYSRQFLSEIKRVLKPGGLFFMMDVNIHTDLGDNLHDRDAPANYGFSLYHCMAVSLYHEGGEGLGAAWGVEKQRQYLEDAGFVKIQQLQPSDQAHSYFVARKKNEL